MDLEVVKPAEVAKQVDLTIYRAINPRWNCSANDALKLSSLLVRMGFPRPQIVCHPQGDGKGWGSTVELTLDDVLRAGVPMDAEVHLHFWFPGRDDRQNCAAIFEAFRQGPVVGYQRIFDELNYGAAPGAWLLQLTRVPRIWRGITDAIAEVISEESAPPSVRPPGSFNLPVAPPIAVLAESGDASGSTAESGEAAGVAESAKSAAAEEAVMEKPTRPEGRSDR